MPGPTTTLDLTKKTHSKNEASRLSRFSLGRPNFGAATRKQIRARRIQVIDHSISSEDHSEVIPCARRPASVDTQYAEHIKLCLHLNTVEIPKPRLQPKTGQNQRFVLGQLPPAKGGARTVNFRKHRLPPTGAPPRNHAFSRTMPVHQPLC